MNTKIISRKDCKGAWFHFPFRKEKKLYQGWTGKPQPLCRMVSLQMGENVREVKYFTEQIKIGV